MLVFGGRRRVRSACGPSHEAQRNDFDYLGMTAKWAGKKVLFCDDGRVSSVVVADGGNDGDDDGGLGTDDGDGVSSARGGDGDDGDSGDSGAAGSVRVLGIEYTVPPWGAAFILSGIGDPGVPAECVKLLKSLSEIGDPGVPAGRGAVQAHEADVSSERIRAECVKLLKLLLATDHIIGKSVREDVDGQTELDTTVTVEGVEYVVPALKAAMLMGLASEMGDNLGRANLERDAIDAAAAGHLLHAYVYLGRKTVRDIRARMCASGAVARGEGAARHGSDGDVNGLRASGESESAASERGEHSCGTSRAVGPGDSARRERRERRGQVTAEAARERREQSASPASASVAALDVEAKHDCEGCGRERDRSRGRRRCGSCERDRDRSCGRRRCGSCEQNRDRSRGRRHCGGCGRERDRSRGRRRCESCERERDRSRGRRHCEGCERRHCRSRERGRDRSRERRRRECYYVRGPRVRAEFGSSAARRKARRAAERAEQVPLPPSGFPSRRPRCQPSQPRCHNCGRLGHFAVACPSAFCQALRRPAGPAWRPDARPSVPFGPAHPALGPSPVVSLPGTPPLPPPACVLCGGPHNTSSCTDQQCGNCAPLGHDPARCSSKRAKDFSWILGCLSLPTGPRWARRDGVQRSSGPPGCVFFNVILFT